MISIESKVREAREDYERYVTTFCEEWKKGDPPSNRFLANGKIYTGLTIEMGPISGDKVQGALRIHEHDWKPMVLHWDPKNLAWTFDTGYERERLKHIRKIEEEKRRGEKSLLDRFWGSVLGKPTARTN